MAKVSEADQRIAALELELELARAEKEFRDAKASKDGVTVEQKNELRELRRQYREAREQA